MGISYPLFSRTVPFFRSKTGADASSAANSFPFASAAEDVWQAVRQPAIARLITTVKMPALSYSFFQTCSSISGLNGGITGFLLLHSFSLSKSVSEKLRHLIKWYHIYLVVQIRVHGAGDDYQLLIARIGIVPHHIGRGVAAEIAGMRLFPVDDKHGAADFAAVF